MPARAIQAGVFLRQPFAPPDDNRLGNLTQGITKSRGKGITSFVFKLNFASLIWRWNMPLRDAVRTYGQKNFGSHGYWMAGPLIVEW